MKFFWKKNQPFLTLLLLALSPIIVTILYTVIDYVSSMNIAIFAIIGKILYPFSSILFLLAPGFAIVNVLFMLTAVGYTIFKKLSIFKLLIILAVGIPSSCFAYINVYMHM